MVVVSGGCEGYFLGEVVVVTMVVEVENYVWMVVLLISWEV